MKYEPKVKKLKNLPPLLRNYNCKKKFNIINYLKRFPCIICFNE